MVGGGHDDKDQGDVFWKYHCQELVIYIYERNKGIEKNQGWLLASKLKQQEK